MRVLNLALVLTVFGGLTACDRQQAAPAAQRSAAVDLRWMDDIDFSKPATQFESQAVVSAEELGTATEARPLSATPTRAAAPRPQATAQRSASSTRTASTASRPRSSGGQASSAGTTQSEPRVVTVKNTKRDAVIGAAAGGALGAVVAGRNNRVKGAVIGAAVGGAAGAVVGSTIDTQKRIEH